MTLQNYPRHHSDSSRDWSSAWIEEKTTRLQDNFSEQKQRACSENGVSGFL